MNLTPIGWVRSTQRSSQERDHGWDREIASIELDALIYTPAALHGLAVFSHIEVIFGFHLNDPADIEQGSRRPARQSASPEVGIFAQRYSHRPNQLGLTRCALTGVEGLQMLVRGLDALDGSPVFDVKPWVEEFGPRGPVRQPAWISELLHAYW